MKILVTGANGFVGTHLIKELAGAGHAVIASDIRTQSGVADDKGFHPCDLRDPESVTDMIRKINPEACIHLGGIASVIEGHANPSNLLAVNLTGTLNILEALRKHTPQCRLLFISTAHVYGPRNDDKPITEDSALKPVNLYSISKACADQICLQYAKEFNMHVLSARANNHIGPGQTIQYVIPSFAAQFKSILKGRQDNSIRTGNLESIRDFTDVRDVVRAYRLLIEKGVPGNAYNISSGRMFKLTKIIEILSKLTGISPKLITDETKYRPADKSPVLDTTRLHRDTGWKPEIELERSITDILNDF